MKVVRTQLEALVLFQPALRSDARGFFYESYNERDFHAVTGLRLRFVQDNHSRSMRGVLRGLHYQIRAPQAKLVRVTAGEIFDVAVDIRRSSPTFGQYASVALSDANKYIRWIPAGFAHGFLVVSEYADVQYKTTEYWAPQFERCIAWDDPRLHIDWPSTDPPLLSEKDRRGVPFEEAEVFP